MAWRLNTRMLRMIAAVADSPSATAAAAQLNITPSALSHQIRDAEETLRVALFERAGRRLSLTSLGEQLLASTRIILAELERAEGSLDRSRRSERPSFRVGGGAYPIHRWFLQHLIGDHGGLPDIDFVSNTRTYPLARAVAEGELDLAFAAGEQRERGIASVPLFEDRLVAVFSRSHPLCDRPFVEAGDLRSERYITYSRVIERGLEDDLLFRPARLAPAQIQEASSVEAILDLVAAGLGFSILSEWAIESSQQKDSVSTRWINADGLTIRWSALMRHSESQDPDLMRLARTAAAGRVPGRAIA